MKKAERNMAASRPFSLKLFYNLPFRWQIKLQIDGRKREFYVKVTSRFLFLRGDGAVKTVSENKLSLNGRILRRRSCCE